MTPRQAVKENCRICLSGTNGRQSVNETQCVSQICPLCKVARHETHFRVKMIKEFCLHCNGGSIKETDACNGKLIHPNRMCPLFPFKNGKTGRKIITTHLDQFKYQSAHAY